MSDLVRARVEAHLVRLRLGAVASRLDSLLSDAARSEPTYLAFLDGLLTNEIDAKQKKRVAMRCPPKTSPRFAFVFSCVTYPGQIPS